MKGKFIIVDIRNMEHFKDENGELKLFDSKEAASFASIFYEMPNVWVLELKENYIYDATNKEKLKEYGTN